MKDEDIFHTLDLPVGGRVGIKNMKNLEKLADLEHKQWAHWTKYMLENMTKENIVRWKKQINTPYFKLSEKEKESDRVWARKVIKIINETTSL